MVGVMYAGRIVEWGETVDIFQSPMHPYTQTLMSSFPSVSGPKHELAMLAGRTSQPAESAVGLPLSSAVSVCDGCLPNRGTSEGRGVGHALGGLLAPVGGVGEMAVA